MTKFRRLIVLSVAMTAVAVSVIAQQNERFTLSTLNVDGIPQKIVVFKANPNGPGSAGTVRIGRYLYRKGYDLMFMQEDFNYHDELTVMLEEDYRFDTWSGDVGVEGHHIDFLHLQNHRYECDGLMACWKNNIQVTSVQRVPWNKNFGKFSHAGDELVTKGFRRYDVTLASGTQIAVYNMHMDASYQKDEAEGRDSLDRDARLAQWQQLKNHILDNMSTRPVIVVGDLNSYYCRDQIKTAFIDAIEATGRATASDVWVELEKQGAYPAEDKTFRGCEDEFNILNGEALDKIIYINPVNGTKISPVAFTIDTENYKHDGKVLGDHYPVAATFEVVSTSGIENVIDEVTDTGHGEVYDLQGRKVKETRKGVYIENGKLRIKK